MTIAIDALIEFLNEHGLKTTIRSSSIEGKHAWEWIIIGNNNSSFDDEPVVIYNIATNEFSIHKGWIEAFLEHTQKIKTIHISNPQCFDKILQDIYDIA